MSYDNLIRVLNESVLYSFDKPGASRSIAIGLRARLSEAMR
ncbi:MAG: hypothetical protein ABJE47_12685 [bacterium]